MIKHDEPGLVQQYAGLVISIIRKLNIPSNCFDDCYQHGMIGVLLGARSFDPSKSSLNNWIYNHIRWEILRYINKEYKHHNHLHLHNNIPEDTPIHIDEYLPKLGKFEEQIICMKLQGHTLKHIADELSLKNIYAVYQDILKQIKDANKKT